MIALQTGTEESSLLNNMVYQGIMGKFNNLFIRKELIAKPALSLLKKNEGSQFYQTQVKLAGNGVRTKATVLYATDSGLLINQDPVISLTVRFHDVNDEMCEITAKTVVSRIAIPQAADIITIAYNANDLSMIAVL